jgi:hypothetical protein
VRGGYVRDQGDTDTYVRKEGRGYVRDREIRTFPQTTTPIKNGLAETGKEN